MQVFEDLDADAIWNEWRQRDVISPDTPDAVDRFLQALREITENDARVLVLTAEWESVKDAARALLRTVPSSYKTDVSE
jgi:archaellum biogenesis ATPase FlaH